MNIWLIFYIVIGAVLVAVFSALGVKIIGRNAYYLGLIDKPNERSSHSQPTPRGGGVVLVVATITGLLICQLIWQITSWQELMFYTGAATLIAVVSWFDDIRTLSARTRFLAHFVAAGFVIAKWGYWEEISLPLFGNIHFGKIGLLLTIVWIVGLTNAYNFMDGIDGIAGGQALVAGLGWAAVGWLIDDKFIIAMSGLLAASNIGFLFYNWSPAKIFMGDVGSAFLGFTFAVIPLITKSSLSVTRDLIPWIGFILLWPFILDTGFTLLRRLSKGENIFQAHRSHLYQRMVVAGYSHQAVSLLYIGLSLIGSIVSLIVIKGF